MFVQLEGPLELGWRVSLSDNLVLMCGSQK